MAMKVHSIISSKYERYTAEIVKQIKSFPQESRLSGDDSPLRSFWEEMQYQMQTGNHAYAFELYEDTVRNCCSGLVESLPDDEQALLWLFSDDFYNNVDERKPSEIPYGVPVIETVTEELYERVWRVAEEDILPNDKLGFKVMFKSTYAQQAKEEAAKRIAELGEWPDPKRNPILQLVELVLFPEGNLDPPPQVDLTDEDWITYQGTWDREKIIAQYLNSEEVKIPKEPEELRVWAANLAQWVITS